MQRIFENNYTFYGEFCDNDYTFYNEYLFFGSFLYFCVKIGIPIDIVDFVCYNVEMLAKERQEKIEKMLSSSDAVFVLADSSKLEKKATYKLCDMNESYTFVTDAGLSEELLQLYMENGKKIIIGGKMNGTK